MSPLHRINKRLQLYIGTTLMVMVLPLFPIILAVSLFGQFKLRIRIFLCAELQLAFLKEAAHLPPKVLIRHSQSKNRTLPAGAECIPTGTERTEAQVTRVNSRTKVCQGFAATLRQQFSATLHHQEGCTKGDRQRKKDPKSMTQWGLRTG
jgi:hypothetical protein